MSNTPRDWTVLTMLEWGTDYFEEKGIPDPRHSIEWLLAEVLGVKRLDLYLKFDRPLSSHELDQLKPLVKRRARHEPLQYILGVTDFMNVRIQVTPDVLIPRIETEQLVEIILDDYSDPARPIRLLDIGTGSGCIPIALKQVRPGWSVTGLDISEEALEVARRNAKENEVEITFFQTDILHSQELETETPFDIIVSNPPYVLPEEKDSLEKQVVNYEPPLALFSNDLQIIYGSIISFAKHSLTENGMLYLELHELHADEILEIFDKNIWNAAIRDDYEKKKRFIIAKKKK